MTILCNWKNLLCNGCLKTMYSDSGCIPIFRYSLPILEMYSIRDTNYTFSVLAMKIGTQPKFTQDETFHNSMNYCLSLETINVQL